MTASPKKGKHSITVLLLLVLIVIIGGFLYSSLPIIKNTELYKNYQANKKATFVSKRANFSFKYPINWPISTKDDEMLKAENTQKHDGYFGKYTEIENITFSKEWEGNAGGDKLGWIMVSKADEIHSLDDYVKRIDKESTFISHRGKFVVPPPEIRYLTVGGENAISENNCNNNLPSLYCNIAFYVVVKDGWIYMFGAENNSEFMKNKEANMKAFQDIIASVKFTN